jgi:succinate dehydrogenase / fumarate reductase membrane anchor subunit
MIGADHATVAAWAGSPLVAGLLILLIVATFYHGALGLQVVCEDYVHGEMPKLALLLIVKAASVVLGLSGVLSVLSLLFAGA